MRHTALLITLAGSSLLQATAVDLTKRQEEAAIDLQHVGGEQPYIPPGIEKSQSDAAAALAATSSPNQPIEAGSPFVETGAPNFQPYRPDPNFAPKADSPLPKPVKDSTNPDSTASQVGKGNKGGQKGQGNKSGKFQGCGDSETIQSYLDGCVALAEAAQTASNKSSDLMEFFFGASNETNSKVVFDRYGQVIEECSGNGTLTFLCATGDVDCNRGPAMVDQCLDKNTVHLCETAIKELTEKQMLANDPKQEDCGGGFNASALLIHEISHALWATWDEPGYGLAAVKEQHDAHESEFLADTWQYFAQSAGHKCKVSDVSSATSKPKEENKETDESKLATLRNCQLEQAKNVTTVTKNAIHPAEHPHKQGSKTPSTTGSRANPAMKVPEAVAPESLNLEALSR